MTIAETVSIIDSTNAMRSQDAVKVACALISCAVIDLRTDPDVILTDDDTGTAEDASLTLVALEAVEDEHEVDESANWTLSHSALEDDEHVSVDAPSLTRCPEELSVPVDEIVPSASLTRSALEIVVLNGKIVLVAPKTMRFADADVVALPEASADP